MDLLGKRPLAASDHGRCDEELELVDETCLEGLGGELSAPDDDVTVRVLLHLPNRFGIEVPLDPRPRGRHRLERPGVHDLLGGLPDLREVLDVEWLAGNPGRALPVSQDLVQTASEEIGADVPREVRFQLVSTRSEPPEGDGWLHEIKHDGHRLAAIVAGDSLKLLSRNGRDCTALFREPFRALTEAGLPPMVLDGEIAVRDERGVTHIDGLSEAISARRRI